MENRYDQYWRVLKGPTVFRRAIAVSVAAHVIVGGGFVVREAFRPSPEPKTVYHMSIVAETMKISETVPEKEVKPETKAAPKVEPPKPKEPPPPKPPKKAEPKVVKPPPPKKVAKVPAKPKAPPKQKKTEKPPVKPPPKPAAQPQPVVVAKREGTPKAGLALKKELPHILNFWARSVRKKVERHWAVPGGVLMDAHANEATVSFWVNHAGQLIGEPEIVKHATDKRLGLSGVQAIKAGAPFPPLPEDYGAPEQEVVYVFRLE
jgi:outer membrane biosynthesis protein TonB